MKRVFPIIPMIVLLFFTANLPANDVIDVAGPDGKVVASVSVDPSGRLTYRVFRNRVAVVEDSPMGITLDGKDLGANVSLGKPARSVINEKYAWRGVKPEAVNHCNEAKIPIIEKDGSTTWTLELRAFNDGFAYRYVVPGEGKCRVTGEATGWKLPDESMVWAMWDTSNYEGSYQKLPVEKIPRFHDQDDSKKKSDKPSPLYLGSPVTVELPDGTYAALLEANVLGYSGMTLRPTATTLLEAAFEDDPEGWTMEGEIRSPWRLTMTGPTLDALVNCDMVPNLATPASQDIFPDGVNTEWLKPGRVLWQWWAYNDPGTHWSKQKWFVDQAAKLGCEYYLVDEGWQHTRQEWFAPGETPWPKMKELCDYAKTKGVGIWVWQGWRYDEKRQWPGLETKKKREEFFRKAAEVGIVGAKIDFMDSESHEMLAFYEDCCREAAKYKIMVNFHGANKPAGEARTWPNEMTREGLKGLEYNKWSALAPSHYATQPFTRNLAGPSDFTPITLQAEFLHGTTYALQLASSVIYTTPLLCWADKPDLYLANEPVADFMRKLPTCWDETRVLPGSEIGRLAAFARRKGDTWYVAIINGDAKEGRLYKLEPAFLGKGTYSATLYADRPDKADALVVSKKEGVTDESTINVEMLPGGGFVGVFEKQE